MVNINLHVLLVKEDAILQNDGYVFIDAIIASLIILFLVCLVVPMTHQLHVERKLLQERRDITSLLRDELKIHITETFQYPITYSKPYNHKEVVFHFENTKDIIKGCVTWIDVKEREEKICLHGYFEK